MLAALALVAILAAGTLLLVRRLNRLRAPERHLQRLTHFLTEVELPSTCEVFGHQLSEGGKGCEWCTDVETVWAAHSAHRTSMQYSLDPDGSTVYLDDDDARVVGYKAVRPRWRNIDTNETLGWITVDRSAPKKSPFGRDLPAFDLTLAPRGE